VYEWVDGVKAGSRRNVRLLLQIFIMVAIIGGLLWYVGIDSFLGVLARVRLEYLVFSVFCYFMINILFAVRLMRVLGREGVRTSFGRTLLGQYAGMLTSDVTPGKSGYVLTPVYLRDQGISTSTSLSCVLGIQSVEFLVKVLGGVMAVVFLVGAASLSLQDLVVASLGIGLMLTGSVLLALMVWSDRMIGLFHRVASSKFLGKITGGLIGKVEEYREGAKKTRGAVPEIALVTVGCWVLKGFEWFFLGLALGITQIGWLGFFLLHPLVTALGFVPLTPSGIGFQEGAITGIFLLLGVPLSVGSAFAILARVMLIVQDLVGIPQIAKSTSVLVISQGTTSKPSSE